MTEPLPQIVLDERALASGHFALTLDYAEAPSDDTVRAAHRLVTSWVEVGLRWGFTARANPVAPPFLRARPTLRTQMSLSWEVSAERIEPCAFDVLRNCLVGHALDVAEVRAIRFLSLDGSGALAVGVPIAPARITAPAAYFAALPFAVDWEDRLDSRDLRRCLIRFRKNHTREVQAIWAEALSHWAEVAQNGYPLDAESFVKGICAIEGIEVIVHDASALETVIDRFEGQEEAWVSVLNMVQWLASHGLAVESVLIE